MLEFECKEDGTQSARTMFMMAMLPLLDQQAYLTNSPILIKSLKILDVAHSVTSIDHTSPYREIRLDPPVMQVRAGLAPIYVLYRIARLGFSRWKQH